MTDTHSHEVLPSLEPTLCVGGPLDGQFIVNASARFKTTVKTPLLPVMSGPFTSEAANQIKVETVTYELHGWRVGEEIRRIYAPDTLTTAGVLDALISRYAGLDHHERK